ncbi:MAG TPA: prephenate/arogenate dehydrogenase family protein [Parvularculaceae bacterium]|nr:prephenate/arogenate dehydrogenase family protein [Parvularculaceae bacterium]HNS86896.1 prephenate/arogenate dehydrogenase family protein [Parvularculaceae bacterium]
MNDKFSRAAIIGIGLIGSSLARALRETSAAREIVGFDLSADVRARAVKCGAVDAAPATLKEAIAGADLIVVSTPVGAMAQTLTDIAQLAQDNALVIDVGSVKGAVVKAAAAISARAHIVPCHPVAGTEQSGPEAGFAALFKDRWSIITPLPREDDAYVAAVKRAADLWRMIGAHIEIMDHEHHDLALAITSHLPHLIAFTLVGAADDLESVTEAEIVKYSAGGFRDFTRIAASDPVMWRDVFLNNKAAILEVLGRFTEELALLQRAIRWGDAETLEKVFARGRALRRAIVAAGQEKDVPNFGRDEKA